MALKNITNKLKSKAINKVADIKANRKYFKDVKTDTKRANRKENIIAKVNKRRDFNKAITDIVQGKDVDTSKLKPIRGKHAAALIKSKFPTRHKEINKLTADLTSGNAGKRAAAAKNYTENVSRRKAVRKQNDALKRIAVSKTIEGGSLVSALAALGATMKDEDVKYEPN